MVAFRKTVNAAIYQFGIVASVPNQWTILKRLYDCKLRLYAHNMGYFQVRYDSRVVIYNYRTFLRLTTGLFSDLKASIIVSVHQIGIKQWLNIIGF